jgi:hypothetical protein
MKANKWPYGLKIFKEIWHAPLQKRFACDLKGGCVDGEQERRGPSPNLWIH